jgi:hypothetical protein
MAAAVEATVGLRKAQPVQLIQVAEVAVVVIVATELAAQADLE